MRAVVVEPAVPDEYVASFPNTYITAWQMLVGKAAVSAADTVFVFARATFAQPPPPPAR